MKTLRILLVALFLAVPFAIPTLATTNLMSGDAGARSREDKERAVEIEENLYDKGTDLLDEHEWRQAAAVFGEVYKMRLSHADGALYWRAWAQNKMGQRSDALSSLVEFQQIFPQSRWAADAKALEAEIRQQAGQHIDPERVDDEELKLMALNALMNTDPAKAVPILEEVVKKNKSKKIRDRAVFVLSQSSSPQAVEILGRMAKDGSNPQLQASALRYLGIMGGEKSRGVLADVYASSPDVAIKKQVLRSYMVNGDRAHLLSIAKSEQNPELRAEAVRQLGIIGAKSELADLYSTESSVDIRKSIIQAMFIGGNADKLGEIARGEKNSELRVTAIKNLGLLGGARSGQLLVGIYQTDSSPNVRRAVIHALFLSNNAQALVDLARKETDRELKKEIVSKLSIMNSKEAIDYLMEYLKE